MDRETEPFAEWIGRSETAHDTISSAVLARWSATLDRDDPPLNDGDAAPPLAHWLHFLQAAPNASLGPDGHPARGGFLPPAHHLPRRMWAGSRLVFYGGLTVGARLERRSTIAAVKAHQSGERALLFVTVRHEIGPQAGAPLVTDEHDIVFVSPGSDNSSKAEPAAMGAWQATLTPDPVMLFRYSAITFNGHRIHYDAPYAKDVEGYQGLVVHGPLVATALLDLLRRKEPGALVRAFRFRALRPFFVDEPISLHGTPGPGDTIALWAATPTGAVGMRAEATVAAP